MAAARKETLELEIRALIAEARKNVQTMQGEISQLAKEAQKAAPQTKAIADALNRVNGQEMKRAAAEAKLFGESLGTVKRQQALVREAMIDLVESGLDPASDEVKKLVKNYDDLETQSKDISKASGDTIDSFDKLKSAVAGGAAAIALFKVASAALDYGEFALNAADTFKAAREEFGIMLQDMDAGAALFDEIQKFNAWTPFDLETTKQGTKLLMGAKVPLSELTEKLTQFGDLSQGNAQRFTSFMSAFSKSSAKGVADMEVLNVYVDQGVQIFDALAAQVGKTAAEIPKMASEGKISFEDLTAAIEAMTSEGGQYFGGMELASKRLSAMKEGLNESVTSLAASYGEMLYPAMVAVVGLLIDMTDAINENPILKGTLAGAITAAILILGAYTIAQTVHAIATWKVYAAKMAVVAAESALKPWMIGVAIAVGAATVAAVAYAASQSKSAESTNSFALAAKTASQAADQYRDALNGLSLEELRSTQATLKAQFARSAGRLGTEQAEANIKMIAAEIERRNKAAIEAMDEAAAKWKAEWAKDYEKDVASRSSDKYAELSLDLKRKFLDAAAAGVGVGGEEGIDKVVAYLAAHEDDLAIDALKGISGANTEVYDEILEYYRKKREDIDKSLDQAERDTLAKLTATKVDDLMLARDKELETAKNNAVLIDAIQKKYAKEISEVRIEEAKKTAEAAFDLANKERALAAKLTASRVDDLELERDRALELFSGTEAQKLAVAQDYAKQIADAQIAEDRRVFEERLAAAQESGSYGEYASLAAENAIADTDVGGMIGAAGAASSNPWMLLITAILEVVSSFESVQDVLNIFKTFGSNLGDVLDPLITDALEPMLDIIGPLASVMGKVLAPAVTSLATIIRVTTGIAQIFMPILEAVADAFEWLNNDIMVPVGNAIINMVNAVIKLLNKIPGINIKKLKNLEEIGEEAEDIADEMERQREAITEMYERQKDQVQDELDAQIDSIRTQYELGLISRDQYQDQAAAYQNAADERIEEINLRMEALLERIEENTGSSGITSIQVEMPTGLIPQTVQKANIAHFDVGAYRVPVDMPAIVHQDELIIPKTFSDGVRSGDVTISGPSGKSNSSTTTSIYVEITVEGSVIKKDELVEDVYDGIAEGISGGKFSPLPV